MKIIEVIYGTNERKLWPEKYVVMAYLEKKLMFRILLHQTLQRDSSEYIILKGFIFVAI